MSINYKDIAVRAAKTFLQAFLAVFILGLLSVSDLTSLKALAIASVAAGLSALQNFVKETL